MGKHDDRTYHPNIGSTPRWVNNLYPLLVGIQGTSSFKGDTFLGYYGYSMYSVSEKGRYISRNIGI